MLFCLYINNFNPDFQNFDFFLPSYNPFKVIIFYHTYLYIIEDLEEEESDSFQPLKKQLCTLVVILRDTLFCYIPLSRY